MYINYNGDKTLMKKLLSPLKNKIMQYLPKNDLHGFEYTVTELVGMYENSTLASKWHGTIISDDIIQYKTSDTIFILGSGPSINEITSSEWEHIRQHNSIGFNYWFAHEFVPTFYAFQGGNDEMLKILQDKYSEYHNIPFIIRGSAFAKGEFNFDDERINLLKNNPVFYINEYPIAGRCSIDPYLLFRYMEALGFMTYSHISKFIPKWRGTLGLLIMLAYQMGYKRIVLCGIDMQKPDHFWDYEPYLSVKQKYSLPDKGTANLMTFTDESVSANTVPRYVYCLRDWMYEKNGVELFIMNTKTVLHPELDVYKYR